MIWKTVLVVMFAVGCLAKMGNDKILDICRLHGAEDKAEEVEAKVMEFALCMNNLFDLQIMRLELAVAMSENSIKTIFRKYCPKTPQLKVCYRNLLTGMAPCMDSSFRDNLPTAYNVSDEFLDYLCFDDGERIASFISEGGIECVKEKITPLELCVDTIKQRISSDQLTDRTRQESCQALGELRNCMVTTLTGCQTRAAATFVESLFSFASKANTCE